MDTVKMWLEKLGKDQSLGFRFWRQKARALWTPPLCPATGFPKRAPWQNDLSQNVSLGPKASREMPREKAKSVLDETSTVSRKNKITDTLEAMKIEAKDRRVLVVDDDPDSLSIIAEALRWEGYQVQTADSGHGAIEQIQNWAPHLVLLDVNMPGFSGIETLRDLRKKAQYVSVMFISGNSTTEAVINGLDAGADDYIPKPFDPLELLARVRTQLRIKDLNDQLREANEKLKELVDIDDLTGLFNMRSVYQRLESEMDRARRFGRQVCVVMMDMDHFKSVNDGHDHLFGSFVLSEVGKIIAQNIRSIDLGARYGGDEFLMILTETSTEGALKFCERLRNAIQAKLFKSGKDEIRLTCSIGFAITPPGDRETDGRGLVRTADHALYDAKRAGRNTVKFIEIQKIAEGDPIPYRKKIAG